MAAITVVYNSIGAGAQGGEKRIDAPPRLLTNTEAGASVGLRSIITIEPIDLLPAAETVRQAIRSLTVRVLL